jgi:hypothetical protein
MNKDGKTIVTQYGEMLNYGNIIKIGVETNWDDAEIDEDGTIHPDFEMIGTDINGTKIPMGNYNTYEDADNAVKALTAWFKNEAFAVYEIPLPEGADA